MAATCKTEGVLGHYHCDACNDDYLEKAADAAALSAEALKIQIDKTNHTGGSELKNQAVASCTAEGYTGDVCCIGCGTVLAAGSKTPIVHDLKKVEAKAATHSAEGNAEHYTCEKCSKLFNDEKASKELAAADIAVAKQAHVYGIQYDTNNHWKACECGDTLEPEAHTFDKWVTVKEATKETEGSKERACTVCGFKQTEKIEVLSTTPFTGDTNPIFLWIALVAVSAVAVVILFVVKKKTQA